MPRGHYFRWTPEAINFLLMNGKMSADQLAAVLGCTRWAVLAKRRSLRTKPCAQAPKSKRMHRTAAEVNRHAKRLLLLSARIEFLKRWKERLA